MSDFLEEPRHLHAGLIAIFLLSATAAWGGTSMDKATYDQRSAARYADLFQSLDRNRDGVVMHSETGGDLNFGPRFDDMDINRDGVVTTPELKNFIRQQHGISIELGHRP
jgi:Ca2+-binding EF-hand superfamily protein